MFLRGRAGGVVGVTSGADYGRGTVPRLPTLMLLLFSSSTNFRDASINLPRTRPASHWPPTVQGLRRSSSQAFAQPLALILPLSRSLCLSLTLFFSLSPSFFISLSLPPPSCISEGHSWHKPQLCSNEHQPVECFRCGQHTVLTLTDGLWGPGPD